MAILVILNVASKLVLSIDLKSRLKTIFLTVVHPSKIISLVSSGIISDSSSNSSKTISLSSYLYHPLPILVKRKFFIVSITVSVGLTKEKSMSFHLYVSIVLSSKLTLFRFKQNSKKRTS